MEGNIHTVQSGDTNGDAAISFAFADGAGNSGATATAVSSGPNVYIDTAGPVITIAGSNPVTAQQSNATYSDAGASATDAHDGSTAVSSSGSVNLAGVGSYTITYSSTDTAGNTSTASRTVTVSGGGGGMIWTGTGVIKAPTIPVPTQPSSGLSESKGAGSDVIAQVNALLAQIDALQRQSSNRQTFTRDLEVGSTGDDVKALQVYLNTHGFTLTANGPGSPGSETTFFGRVTKAALIDFQKVVGISPTSGYFGPKTRAYIASH